MATGAIAGRRGGAPGGPPAGADGPGRGGGPSARPGAAPLAAFFTPASVAVIGATEKAGSVGRTLFRNLVDSPFGGSVYPVNPKRASILGVRAYPRLAALPEVPELAVVVTPAPAVPGVIRECVEAGLHAAIVISAGFKEMGAPGEALERDVLAEARKGRLRVVGPNCLGIMNPVSGLNATFADGIAARGRVAFLSQSGALCTAVLDWSRRTRVGFSSFVSVGTMLDVGWGDLILHLGDDPDTRAIVMYMESIGDARSFLSAAREVALAKPIIVIKAGRSEAAAKAAASHTGALAGSDDVLDAAFRRAGVLRVNTIAELFYMAEILGSQPRPAGPRLTILTNAGGPGVLATDALIAAGGALADLGPATKAALDGILPPQWSRGNPVDVLGDAEPERYARALEIAARDPGSDGLLVILTPQAMTDPAKTAEALVKAPLAPGKPVLASWMGGPGVEAGERLLNAAGIPTFPYPDTAARAFEYLWQHADLLAHLYETPVLPAGLGEGGDERAGVDAIVAAVAKTGRTLLTEAEAKRVLAAYGIPVSDTRVAVDEAAAVAAAGAIGYPVVVKLHSLTLTHKTDVGGVKLNLPDAASVRRAFGEIRAAVTARASAADFAGVTVQPFVRREGYELIVGSSVDAQCGPVILFGTGGQLVEVFKDRSLGLPPLTTTLARRLIERTKISRALAGVRGRAAIDRCALEQLLVRFSYLVAQHPRIREIDINPLLASPAGLIALDARILLHAASEPDAALPRTAIRPYPARYRWPFRLRDGREAAIRPIRPEDEPAIVDFHRRLSERTVYRRFFNQIPFERRVAHDRLSRICFIDYDRQMVLVAEERSAAGAGPVLGVARITRTRRAEDAEFALLLCDKCQGVGLGTAMLGRLIEVAKAEGIGRLWADIQNDNFAMRRLADHFGFTTERTTDPSLVRCTLEIAAPGGGD